MKYLRAQITYADENASIDMPNRVIRGASAIQRGVALGHGGWIDKAFVKQVVEAGNAKLHVKTNEPVGVKSHFTHGSLSGDGLGDYLGRHKNFRLKGDRALGDLHIARSADPAKATMILERAQEDPAAFGMSIVFQHDQTAEEEFAKRYRKAPKEGMAFKCRKCLTTLRYCMGRGEDAEIRQYAGEQQAVRCAECGTENDPTFQSPDELNAENLPHWRLKSLHAVDAVDEPAANEDGFLSQEQELVTNLDTALRYAARLTNLEPNELVLGRFGGEKVREFLDNWLDRNGLVLLSSRTLKMATCPECGTSFDPANPVTDPEPSEESADKIHADLKKALGQDDGDPAPATDPPADPAADPPLVDPPADPSSVTDPPVDSTASAVQTATLGAIAYRTAHPNGTEKAPKTEPWNGADEVRAATVEDLHVMSTYCEDGKADLKGAYKLPHHKADAGHDVVWRGVANAASREPQTAMPDSARPGVRGHLGDHYHEFDETPPWERNATDWHAYTTLYRLAERRGAPAREERAAMLRQCGFELEADALQNVIVLTAVAPVPDRRAALGDEDIEKILSGVLTGVERRADEMLTERFTDLTGSLG